MSRRTENTRRSNHSIFLPQNFGSPVNDMTDHIAGLGLARLDFERGAVAGEVIYTVEGDLTPTSQQEEEARIATLAYALRKLGNPEDAAEFMRCLNSICEEGDARYRQVAASYHYGEIAERGAGPVLKEMALIAMNLASLNPVTEETESDSEIIYAFRGESMPRSLFDREVAEVERMVRGRRKSSCLVHDDWTEWLNDLEANGATVEELDDAFRHVEALDQYDEGGAIVRMSAHERTFTCGRLDQEFTADDLPDNARFLADDLFRAYASGVEIEDIRNEINAKLDVLFPVTGMTAEGSRFFSRANIELQRFTHDALEALLEDCFGDFHLNAMRNNRSYRRFYTEIRCATDTAAISELMKQAYEARQNDKLSVKHLIALNTAADNQRERLLSAPLSATAYRLINEIVTASEKKLGYLGWAMYGDNNPSHPVHTLSSREQTRIWEFITARKATTLILRLYARLCSTWGRVMPVAWFILPVALKALLELPRLRKALSVVQNKRRASIRKSYSAPDLAVPTLGASPIKKDAAVKSRAEAATGGRR
ncbi:MAG TPA: hypothetical protein VFY40_18225 [Blastocatellia bacterium]|nr:hypothetical protein [Blastocatellia bacterium]